MIELRDISFSYGSREVLKNISLTLKKGELCALVGKNGCGKTTLSRLIAGLCEPRSGEIMLEKKPYKEYGSKPFARLVSFFAQKRPTPNMKTVDYVAYGRYPHCDISLKLSCSDKEAVKRALEMTGAERFSSRNVASLSGGERQLVYLAQAAAQDSDYMILDEPTAFMDAANTFAVADLLGEFSKKGKCVLSVMHDIPIALKYFSRILVMSNGEIIYDGDPEGAVSSKSIEKAFGVSCEKIENDYILRKIECSEN